MKDYKSIAGLLKESKDYNLQVECIVSMINHLAPQAENDEIEIACQLALMEWDL